MIYVPWVIFIAGCIFLIWRGFRAKRDEQGTKISPSVFVPVVEDEPESEPEMVGANQSTRKYKGAENGSYATSKQSRG